MESKQYPQKSKKRFSYVHLHASASTVCRMCSLYRVSTTCALLFILSEICRLRVLTFSCEKNVIELHYIVCGLRIPAAKTFQKLGNLASCE